MQNEKLYVKADNVRLNIIKICLYICFIACVIQLSGCAGNRVRVKGAQQQYITLSAVPHDVVEIHYIRRNVKTNAYEILTVTSGYARLERFGGRAFEPKKMQIADEMFTVLAEEAVSLQWNVSPKRVVNPILEEELVLKTKDTEEHVLFEESLSGGFKEFYLKLFNIRQEMLTKK